MPLKHKDQIQSVGNQIWCLRLCLINVKNAKLKAQKIWRGNCAYLHLWFRKIRNEMKRNANGSIQRKLIADQERKISDFYWREKSEVIMSRTETKILKSYLFSDIISIFKKFFKFYFYRLQRLMKDGSHHTLLFWKDVVNGVWCQIKRHFTFCTSSTKCPWKSFSDSLPQLIKWLVW